MLIAIAVGLIITRVAAVALTFTGISRDLARFQARSAYTGVGFTTTESERIVVHPVRRRIVMQLMLLGNAGVAVMVASTVGIFLDSDVGRGGILTELMWLALGLLLIWLIARSKWLDEQMFRIVGMALKKFTRLEVYDYQGLLQLSDGFAVVEQTVQADDWIVGRSLAEMRLTMEGIQVLGIRRADGDFVGTPIGSTYIRNGDKLVLYGEGEDVSGLCARKAGVEGDEAHEKKCEEQRRRISEQASSDRHEDREESEKEN